ncbi:hypothetical protein V8E53_010610 [Lactarius tabidus]
MRLSLLALLVTLPAVAYAAWDTVLWPASARTTFAPLIIHAVHPLGVLGILGAASKYVPKASGLLSESLTGMQEVPPLTALRGRFSSECEVIRVRGETLGSRVSDHETLVDKWERGVILQRVSGTQIVQQNTDYSRMAIMMGNLEWLRPRDVDRRTDLAFLLHHL